MSALPISPIKFTERASGRASSSPSWLLVRFFIVHFHPNVIPSRRSRHLGESGLGKSTLINTLFNTPLYPPKEPVPPSAERPKTVAIESIGAGMIRLPVTRSRIL
jgi:hypothetical protein